VLLAKILGPRVPARKSFDDECIFGAKPGMAQCVKKMFLAQSHSIAGLVFPLPSSLLAKLFHSTLDDIPGAKDGSISRFWLLAFHAFIGIRVWVDDEFQRLARI